MQKIQSISVADVWGAVATATDSGFIRQIKDSGGLIYEVNPLSSTRKNVGVTRDRRDGQDRWLSQVSRQSHLSRVTLTGKENLCREWAKRNKLDRDFFLSENGRRKNIICSAVFAKEKCKQSYRAVVIECPSYHRNEKENSVAWKRILKPCGVRLSFQQAIAFVRHSAFCKKLDDKRTIFFKTDLLG